MTVQRHETILEVKLNTDQAQRSARELQQVLDQINATAGQRRDMGPVPGAGGPMGPGGPGGGGSAVSPTGGQRAPDPSWGASGRARGEQEQNRQSLLQMAQAAHLAARVEGAAETAASAYTAQYGAQTALGAGAGERLQAIRARGGLDTFGSSALAIGSAFGPVGTAIGGGIKAATSIGGALYGATLEREAQGKELRMVQAERDVAIQRELSFARMGGSAPGTGATGTLALLQAAQAEGIGGEEAAGWLRSAGGSFRGATQDWEALLALRNTGVGAGSISGYTNQMAPGGGGINGSAARAIAVAQQQGLTGAKVEEFLGIIAGNTGRMASQGLTVDVGAMETFAARLGATEGGPQGTRAATAAAALMSPVEGARQAITAPFAQYAQTAVLARAMRAGGGIMGTLKELERGAATGPEYTLGALGGGQLGQLAVAGMGFSSAEAAAITGPLAEAKVGGPQTREVSQAERDSRRQENAALEGALSKFGDRLSDAFEESLKRVIGPALEKLYSAIGR